MQNIRLFGFRVMVERVTERAGSIIVPDIAQGSMLWQIGRVVSVGDGKVGDKVEEPLVEVGNLVYFQSNMAMAASQQYERNKESYLNLHQGDLVARLNDNSVEYGHFEPLGRWILVEPFLREEESLLIMPDTATTCRAVYFRVAKFGSRVNLPLVKGQEVILNTGRVCPIFIKHLDLATGESKLREFSYVDRDYVLGTVGE